MLGTTEEWEVYMDWGPADTHCQMSVEFLLLLITIVFEKMSREDEISPMIDRRTYERKVGRSTKKGVTQARSGKNAVPTNLA